MTKKKKIILKRNQHLYLKDTGLKGRGVFCLKDIRAGEILEVTPSLILNEAATNRVEKTLLANYTFAAENLPKRILKRKKIKRASHSSAVVMGIASFCNHDEKSNAEILWEEQGGTLYYSLRATRRIPRNTEICTTYGKGWFDDR